MKGKQQKKNLFNVTYHGSFVLEKELVNFYAKLRSAQLAYFNKYKYFTLMKEPIVNIVEDDDKKSYTISLLIKVSNAKLNENSILANDLLVYGEEQGLLTRNYVSIYDYFL